MTAIDPYRLTTDPENPQPRTLSGTDLEQQSAEFRGTAARWKWAAGRPPPD